MQNKIEVAKVKIQMTSGNLYWAFEEISAPNANHLVAGNLSIINIPLGDSLYTYTADDATYELEVLETRIVELE